MSDQDPFRHNPQLRAKIKPASESFFRDGFRNKVQELMKENEVLADFITPDDVREAKRKAFLADRAEGDFWIFAYGSLIWDPGIEFQEIRRARIADYARRFCLFDDKGGRGTAEAPGLMAGLDFGPGCDGIAFRLADDAIDRETEFLWQREMIGTAYCPTIMPAQTPQGPITLVAFVANHDSDEIDGNLSHKTQVQYIATGAGILGSSYDYLKNLFLHLVDLDIQDPHVARLWDDVNAYRAGRT